MRFLDNLWKFFAGDGPRMFPLAVKCKRCGEILNAQVNLANDLSVEYDDSERAKSYTCRKVLMGSGRCFQQVEVILTFDTGRVLKDKVVHGGSFVEG